MAVLQIFISYLVATHAYSLEQLMSFLWCTGRIASILLYFTSLVYDFKGGVTIARYNSHCE